MFGFVSAPCIKLAASKGVVTTSQSQKYCHGDCKNPEEKKNTMSDHEDENEVNQVDMAEAIRKLDEFFEETLNSMQASVDKIAASKLKSSVKLEKLTTFLVGYSSSSFFLKKLTTYPNML